VTTLSITQQPMFVMLVQLAVKLVIQLWMLMIANLVIMENS